MTPLKVGDLVTAFDRVAIIARIYKDNGCVYYKICWLHNYVPWKRCARITENTIQLFEKIS